MTFEEILDQAIAMLQRRGRLTYRTLKRQFDLDDDALDKHARDRLDHRVVLPSACHEPDDGRSLRVVQRGEEDLRRRPSPSAPTRDRLLTASA